MTGRDEIVVVGAGVIGISTALELARRGRTVRVIDREGVAAGASRGNAGAFAFSDIEPLATPGIIRKAPGWLFDPLGPLAIPPSYALGIAPWLWRFWKASRPKRHEAGAAAQARLMALSRQAFERLVARFDGERLLQRDGALELYEGRGAFEASRPVWDRRRAHGIAFEHLESPEAIAEVQPGLASRFTHAGYVPDWVNVVDPLAWTEHLAGAFLDAGGRIETGEVRGLAVPADGGVEIRLADRTLRASRAVIAAGAWSHHLARCLGERIPLETERGYNTTLPPGAFDLRTHLSFGDHGFVVTRIRGGVRVGGAVELGGLDLPPNWPRADALLARAAAFMPGLDVSGGTRWMGFRPSLPDSLPVLSRAAVAPSVVYAFGHGHLGLTQSAGSAEIAADLVTDAEPAIPIDAFSARRFRGGRA